MNAITVLLSEPQAIMREGLRAVLEGAPDITVVGDVANAGDASVLVQQLRPDVVLVDLAVTAVEGIDALRRIRAASSATRILILAAQQDAGTILRALQAGAHGVVLRRTSGKALIEAVRAVQSGGTYISGEASDALIRGYLEQRSGLAVASPLHRLSQRERQVLGMVVNGQTSSQIAEVLAISPKSVDTYRGRLMKKLGTRDVPALVKFAIHHGVTPLSQPS